MKFILYTLATLAACVSHAVADNTTFAPPPLGVVGHTAVVSNNTVFIQGGKNKDGTLSTVSYAIILGDSTNSLKNATWQDTSDIAKFTPRDYGIAIPLKGYVLTCGTVDSAHTGMSCDSFNTYTYNLSQTDIPVSSAGGNRGAMAVAVSSSDNKAYIVGGINTATLTTPAYTMNLTAPSAAPVWKAGESSLNLKYHTATWVDGDINGVVVLGGISGVGVVSLNSPQIFAAAGNWGITTSTGVNPLLFGHTAVNDGKGNIYIYGGINSPTGSALNQHWLLNTNSASWSLQALTAGPEARAFHTATLLPDGTIMYAFGTTGSDQKDTASTYFTFNTGGNSWSDILSFPTMNTTTRSPNIPPPPPPVNPSLNGTPSSSGNNNTLPTPTGNNTPTPNTPKSAGSDPSTGSGPSSSGTSASKAGINIPMIAGISAAGVVLIFLIVLLIFLIRRRNRRRPIRQYPMIKRDMAGPSYDDDEKAKNAKAFMIRRPPSVYMVDETGRDDDVPPSHYKSQYYGDHPLSVSGRDSPSVAEYELTPPSGGFGRMNTLSTVSSVAERRRFLDEQQRQFMDGSYENAHHDQTTF